MSASRFLSHCCRPAAVVLVAAMALAVCGCRDASVGVDRSNQTAAAKVPAPAARTAILGEARLDSPRLLLQLTDVTRAGERVTVTFLVRNVDAAPLSLRSIFAASPADADTVADACLIDAAREKKYFVLRDDQGRAASGPVGGEIAPGESRSLWARFPAPPPGVKRITVQIPPLSPFRDVPIGEQVEGGTR